VSKWERDSANVLGEVQSVPLASKSNSIFEALCDLSKRDAENAEIELDK
jgi:hypothetical protein